MFGVTRKPQRRDHAKTPLLPPTNPSPIATFPSDLPGEADHSRLTLSLPPPYAAIDTSQSSNTSPQPKLYSPSPPWFPVPSAPQDPPKTPKKPKDHGSKPAAYTKPRKNLRAAYVSKAAKSPSAVSLPGNGDGKSFEKQHEEPVLDIRLCDLISSKLNSVITSIDGEQFSGDAKDLEIREDGQSGLRGGWGNTTREVSRRADKAISSAIISTNYFSKVYLYANSRLPPNLPPLKLSVHYPSEYI